MPPLAVFSIKNRPLGAVVSHVTNLLPRGREHGLRGLPGVTSGGAPRVELLTAGLTTALQPAFPGASRDRALPPCRYHLPSSWSPTERPRPAPGGRVWGVAWPSRTVGWVGGVFPSTWCAALRRGRRPALADMLGPGLTGHRVQRSASWEPGPQDGPRGWRSWGECPPVPTKTLAY